VSSILFSNLNGIKSLKQVRQTGEENSTSLERLSSGMRINSPSDDPGGLILAETLKNETALANIAIQNANDAISFTNTIDSSLESINTILERMAELAEQSSNTLITNQQRSFISSEFNALGGEIARIASTAKYNDINLLSNSNSVVFQVGVNGQSGSSFVFQGVSGTLQQLRLGYDNDLNYSVIANTELASQQAARTALAAVRDAIEEVGLQRGAIGANENRLNTAIANLESSKDINTIAESNIRDVNVASELTNLLKNEILTQVQTAVAAIGPLNQNRVTALLS
jgi:flagellin